MVMHALYTTLDTLAPENYSRRTIAGMKHIAPNIHFDGSLCIGVVRLD
jgi:hypothetical protein